MEVLFLLLILVLLWLCYPYVRCLWKRLGCYKKLKGACKAKGFLLRGNHRFWLLSGRDGGKFDLFIETPTEVYGIKLFGVVHHLRTLVFVENSAYLLQRHAGVMLWIKDETLDGKSKELMKYEFLYKGREIAPEKKRSGILLVNPVPVEMLQRSKNGKEVVLNPGDRIRDYEVYNLTGMLRRLEDSE